MSEQRYSLYRLCACVACGGSGRLAGYTVEKGREVGGSHRCPECRGEGRVRQEVATCATEEAVGVAIVTLGREGEWADADGNPCAFGLLDREGEKGQKWLVLPWSAYTPRHVTEAAKTLARSKGKR